MSLQECLGEAGVRHLEVGEDGTDVTLKAHVDHAVSLIQGQVATDVQADHFLLEQIHEASRRGYHHVDTTENGETLQFGLPGSPYHLLRGPLCLLLTLLPSLPLGTSPMLAYAQRCFLPCLSARASELIFWLAPILKHLSQEGCPEPPRPLIPASICWPHWARFPGKLTLSFLCLHLP